MLRVNCKMFNSRFFLGFVIWRKGEVPGETEGGAAEGRKRNRKGPKERQ